MSTDTMAYKVKDSASKNECCLDTPRCLGQVSQQYLGTIQLAIPQVPDESGSVTWQIQKSDDELGPELDV